MGAPDNFGNHAVPFMPTLGMLNQYQNPHPLQMVPPQPLVTPSQVLPPSMAEQQRADTIHGFGVLTWLSAKAGLITCKDKMIISFQLKDFCDQMLNDLTSVLRVGFTLSFHAALNETSEYTATIVSPIYGPDADVLFANSQEVDLEAANPTPPNSKDAYSPALEQKAIPALLAIFQRHGLQQIQLSRSFSLHSQMSNCGDDELFRYVGTSSLKRRQFVERRTHLFRLQNDDSIILQYPAVYQAVYQLASYLLRRGGATSIQSLFDYYGSPDIMPEVRSHTGEGRQDFLNLLTAHNWVFALFPNRTYVSVRRNLPNYDYVGFIKQHFQEMDITRSQQMAYGQPPRGIQRTMSAQMGSSFATGRPQNLLMQHQHAMTPAATRSGSLWDSQSSLSQSGNSGDQWSPLFSPSTWSNNTNANPRLTSLTPLSSMNETLLSGVNYNSLLAMPPSAKNERSIGVQADDFLDRMSYNPIGRTGCTCQCQCGRGGAAIIGNTRGSSSRASGGSASPPSADGASQIDRFSPSNHAGSIGDRTLTAAALGVGLVDQQPAAPNHDGSANQPQRYYDPFGTADLLNGTRLNSLRIGN